MDVFKLVGDKTGVANMLGKQGAVYFNQGDEAKFLALLLQSLKMAEAIGDVLRFLTSLPNIGAVYLNKTATYQKALEYFLRLYKLSLAIQDTYPIGFSTANPGETCYKMGDDSTALVLFESISKGIPGYRRLTLFNKLYLPLYFLCSVTVSVKRKKEAMNCC